MNWLKTFFAISGAIFLASTVQVETVSANSPIILAEADQMDHHEGHSMEHDGSNADMSDEAAGIAILHKIDTEQSVVNLTHEPIPVLKWPTMTMDLPVGRGVDLTQFSEGDKVQFSLKQGRDKVYRIMEMCLTESMEVVDGLCKTVENANETHEDHYQ